MAPRRGDQLDADAIIATQEGPRRRRQPGAYVSEGGTSSQEEAAKKAGARSKPDAAASRPVPPPEMRSPPPRRRPPARASPDGKDSEATVSESNGSPMSPTQDQGSPEESRPAPQNTFFPQPRAPPACPSALGSGVTCFTAWFHARMNSIMQDEATTRSAMAACSTVPDGLMPQIQQFTRSQCDTIMLKYAQASMKCAIDLLGEMTLREKGIVLTEVTQRKRADGSDLSYTTIKPYLSNIQAMRAPAPPLPARATT